LYASIIILSCGSCHDNQPVIFLNSSFSSCKRSS
jgi:hypothetical protein